MTTPKALPERIAQLDARSGLAAQVEGLTRLGSARRRSGAMVTREGGVTIGLDLLVMARQPSSRFFFSPATFACGGEQRVDSVMPQGGAGRPPGALPHLGDGQPRLAAPYMLRSGVRPLRNPHSRVLRALERRGRRMMALTSGQRRLAALACSAENQRETQEEP